MIKWLVAVIVIIIAIGAVGYLAISAEEADKSDDFDDVLPQEPDEIVQTLNLYGVILAKPQVLANTIFEVHSMRAELIEEGPGQYDWSWLAGLFSTNEVKVSIKATIHGQSKLVELYLGAISTPLGSYGTAEFVASWDGIPEHLLGVGDIIRLHFRIYEKSGSSWILRNEYTKALTCVAP